MQASDRGLVVAGDAASSVDFVAAKSVAATAPAGFELWSANIRAPLAKPYVFSCARAPDAIVLAGSVPNEAVKASVLAAAGAIAPKGKVKDGLKFASGAPAGVDYSAATAFCLAEIAELTNGSGQITDAAFNIAGEAPDAGVHAKVTRALTSAMPAGLRLGSVSISQPTISPYAFQAVKEAGALVLSGYYPDDKTHDDIISAARRRFFAEKVDDKLKIGAGAPNNFAAAAVATLGRLSRLVSGKAVLTDAALEISGEAPFEKVAEDISVADQLPAEYQAHAAITAKSQDSPLEAVGCQTYFTNLLTLGNIRFTSGSAEIKNESFALLDALAATAARCQDAKIEVSGHTDATGGAELNNELSLRRAQAVVAYLTKFGLPLGNLTAVGFGSSRPIAPNDTEEGRAKNRRIVFEVK